jgi:ADP-ribose pyrophosphatase YjhB (NUDIX family)
LSKRKRKYCPFCGAGIIKRKEGDVLREYCPSCQTFFYDNPLPVVSCILLKEREVLLVKRGNQPYKGKWCLPSGFAETGESIQAAALRELEEETGLQGKITGLVDADSTKNYFYGDLIFHTFEVEPTGGTLKAGDDAVDVKYFPIHHTPLLAFKSNTEAINTFIKAKSEFWAIIDSFSLSVSSKNIAKHHPNFLSDILVEVIEKNAELISDHWVKDVIINKSTPSYNLISPKELSMRFNDDAGQYISWLTGNYSYEKMKKYYRNLGAMRKKEGYALSELISALSLIRKYIWEFALAQGMWNKTIDIYRTLELERRMMLFFDKASYNVCKGYE